MKRTTNRQYVSSVNYKRKMAEWDNDSWLKESMQNTQGTIDKAKSDISAWQLFDWLTYWRLSMAFDVGPVDETQTQIIINLISNLTKIVMYVCCNCI